jgi:hypothetical protein
MPVFDPITKRVLRDKLPLEVIRGFYPTEPGKLSSTLPPIDDEDIKSGMVVVKDTGAVRGVAGKSGFRKAQATDAQTESLSFFIALHDGDSHDVTQASGLVGLDCSDDYELRTGYYTAPGGGWNLDDPLTVGDDGVLVLATSGDMIVGYITAIGGGTGNAIEYTGKTPSTSAANSLTIQFKTARHGQTKAA